MPVCPIYGCSLFAVYLLAGTPDEGRGLLKHAQRRVVRYPLYFLLAFLVPSVAELFVGFFFDKAFGVWLWSYKSVPLNLGGYVCLPVSLAWAGLIFLFMKFLFPPIFRVLGKIPLLVARLLAIFLLLFALSDIFVNFMRIT